MNFTSDNGMVICTRGLVCFDRSSQRIESHIEGLYRTVGQGRPARETRKSSTTWRFAVIFERYVCRMVMGRYSRTVDNAQLGS